MNDESDEDGDWFAEIGRLVDEPEGIDPEPGDTVVEYRDGEAWIYVVPEPDGDPSPDRS